MEHGEIVSDEQKHEASASIADHSLDEGGSVTRSTAVSLGDLARLMSGGWLGVEWTARPPWLTQIQQVITTVSFPSVASTVQRVLDIYNPDIAAAIKASSVIKEMASSLSAVASAALNEQIQDVVQNLNGVTRYVTAVLGLADELQDMLQQLKVFEPLQEIIKDEVDAADAFRAAGWPIAPSMPKSLRRSVITLYQNGKVQYATQAIEGYYRRENYRALSEAVGTWRSYPLFKSRMHIIDDALKAHKEGTYTLSVPALIVQVEGLMNDYVVVNHLTARLGKMPDLYKAVIGNPETREIPFTTWAIADTLLCHLASNTYAWTDFRQELALPAKKRHASRHTIVHGINTRYDREKYSLQFFLLLDALSALLQFEPDEEARS